MNEKIKSFFKRETGEKSTVESFGNSSQGFYLEMASPKYIQWLEAKALQAIENEDFKG